MFTRVAKCLVIGWTLAAWLAVVAPAVAASDSASSGHADGGGAGVEPGDPAHGGGHGEVDLNPLSWNRDLAIWTAVVFVVLLLVLGRFAWGPISDGLDKRERRIAGEITAAEKANADAKGLLAEYQQKLAASEEDVRRMIEAAKRDAEKVGEGIVDKARDQAEAEHRRALEEIDLATAGALEELAQRSATLAVELAGKIVEARLDPAAHSQLIERAVSNFSKAEPGNN